MAKYNTIRSLLELDARSVAKSEMDVMGDRTDRITTSRMSDQQLRIKKQKELQDMAKSSDPIDRQIYTLKQRIASLRKKKQLSKKPGE